jgi:hypothetical protein
MRIKMAIAELDGRKQAILDALTAEIERQAIAGYKEMDLVALAVAVDRALGGDGVMPGGEIDDGKEPDELNAANDV